MTYDFDGKTFRVLRNDGPGAEVTEETVFHFRQDGEIVHAEHSGGGVRFGTLLGVVAGDTLTHRYIQMNRNGDFQGGHSSSALSHTGDGAIRIVDSWEWQTMDGRGECVMQEEA